MIFFYLDFYLYFINVRIYRKFIKINIINIYIQYREQKIKIRNNWKIYYKKLVEKLQLLLCEIYLFFMEQYFHVK